MQNAIEVLQAVGVFLVGVLARFGVFLAVIAVLVLPALAIALTIRAISAQRRRALGIRRVAGVLFRPDVLYSPGHTWLRGRGRAWSARTAEAGERSGALRNGGPLELGIDDLAQRLIPAVTAVDLPSPGTTVARGETIATLHGGGRAVRIPAPVAGTISGTNVAVLRDPMLVKRDGYGRGWLVAIRPADPSFAQLPTGAEAESWLARESARWSRFVEERLGFAAADGGELLAPAPWLIGEEGWKELKKAFLEVPAG
jgi:glycine cleavage system H lipoate-binding protein